MLQVILENQGITSIAKKAIEIKRWRSRNKEYSVVKTMDIKNVLNSVIWEHMLATMRTTKNIKNCFVINAHG